MRRFYAQLSPRRVLGDAIVWLRDVKLCKEAHGRPIQSIRPRNCVKEAWILRICSCFFPPVGFRALLSSWTFSCGKEAARTFFGPTQEARGKAFADALGNWKQRPLVEEEETLEQDSQKKTVGPRLALWVLWPLSSQVFQPPFRGTIPRSWPASGVATRRWTKSRAAKRIEADRSGSDSASFGLAPPLAEPNFRSIARCFLFLFATFHMIYPGFGGDIK